MSAICGVFRKRASPEQCGEAINRMTESMKLIGPDSLNIRNFGPVTLAHQALIVSPHEKTNSQPLYLPDEGLSIVYDGRLYNRSEILETLKDRPRPDAPDAHLLLKLYEQIGTKAFHKANGEFAVAIYDHRKQELLLARDPVGHRILYYADTPEFFAFASSTDALVTLPEIESGIDPVALAAHLLSAYEFALARGQTLHKAIRCQKPAHTVRINGKGVSEQRYHSFSQYLSTGNFSFDEAIEGLRYHTTRSVEDRIGSSQIVGTSLSGGLDSSGVTAIAARYMQSKDRPIHAFSATPTQAKDPLSLEEIEHIKTIAVEFQNIEHHLIASDNIGPFSGLEKHIAEEDTPLGPFYYPYTRFSEEANTLGIRTYLTGNGGDILASNNGFGCFAHQLISNSPLSSPKQIINSLKKHHSIKGFIAQEILTPLFPEWINSLLLPKNKFRKKIENSSLKRDFIQDHDIDERLKDETLFHNKLFRDQLKRAAHIYDNGLSTFITPQFGRKQQVEFLHPLEDRLLIEFCLSLPIEYFGYGSQKRGFYREAMKGIIPNSVRSRNTKGAFIPLFHRSVRNEKETIDRILREMPYAHEIWKVVDRTVFLQRKDRILSDSNDYQMTYWDVSIQADLFPIIAYGLFLSHKL